MDKNEILNSDLEVRRNVAGNPNTPADVLTELAKDSDCDVRTDEAATPHPTPQVLTEDEKGRDCGCVRQLHIQRRLRLLVLTAKTCLIHSQKRINIAAAFFIKALF